MDFSNLLKQTGQWLRETGPDSDIAISTRVRLARNIEGYRFISQASPRERKEIEHLLRDKIGELNIGYEIVYINLLDISPLDRMLLVERHLMSKEHANAEWNRGLGFEQAERISIMVNEEDHLRIQVLRAGLELKQSWELINKIDDAFATLLPYAFHPTFGYLTACPTNVGSGLRVSVMMHLPALFLTKEIEKVYQAVSRINITLRGSYGEGTRALGDLYQFSNQISLGRMEEQIIDNIFALVIQIIQYERKLREKLLEQDKARLEDRVARAYAILREARLISSEETLELLSSVRMGICLGLLPNLKMETINQLFILAQPAHLQKMEGRSMEPAERDAVRAQFLKLKLACN